MNVKTVLTVVAVILGILLAMSVVGMVITAVQYLFWLGVICLAVFVALKLFKKSEPPQLESKDPLNVLKNAEQNAARSIEEYKRKYLAK